MINICNLKKKKKQLRGCYLTDAVEAGGRENTLRD